ncbi:MAG TPA: ABC transporter ATP-binding protein [Candidatus Dojkabacteria bacterium]|nr:ABC transporter ATP-binding protein [Candidatus Dojkabacteria bacterium]
MKKIVSIYKPYLLNILIVIALVYIQVTATLALPDYMARIVNEGIVIKNSDIILTTGAEMLLITLIGAIATIIAGLLSSKIATGVAKDLRAKLFSKVESYSLVEFDKFSTSSLITRSTNDIQQIQQVTFMTLRMVVSAPLMGIGAVINAYQNAPSMSWLILMAVILISGMIGIIFAIALPKFKILQKLIDKLNLVTRENLTGLRVIRAFTNEKYEQKKFSKVNDELMQVNLFVNRISVVMQPVMMLIFNLTSIAIIWVGAGLINLGELNIGNMMAFMQYAMQVISSFLMLTIIFILIPRASVSVQRVEEVLKSEPEIKDPRNPRPFPNDSKGKIEFKNVSFSYPKSDIPIIKNVSFIVEPGQTTAIIGSTGSGKSTLINLIPRFYDPTNGEVLVDGINIKEVLQSDLRDKIGYVPQKGILFSGTVKSNIKYGVPNADDRTIEEAAKTAQALDFINKFEHGFDNDIAQGGANVSGGQKQRLSIARAIAKNPEIYIFDDSFSALDFKTDSKLRQALAQATKEATVIIVTQRIGTILNADKIIVMDEGKIVGSGRHQELLSSCKVYREIAESQLSEKELERSK